MISGITEVITPAASNVLNVLRLIIQTPLGGKLRASHARGPLFWFDGGSGSRLTRVDSHRTIASPWPSQGRRVCVRSRRSGNTRPSSNGYRTAYRSWPWPVNGARPPLARLLRSGIPPG